MKIKDILLIITAMMIVSCNGGRKSETFRLLEDVESYMDERPDSALVVLHTPKTVRESSRNSQNYIGKRSTRTDYSNLDTLCRIIKLLQSFRIFAVTCFF